MGGVSAIHLGVVELERYHQRGLEQASLVLAPDHKRIAENAADNMVSCKITHKTKSKIDPLQQSLFDNAEFN